MKQLGSKVTGLVLAAAGVMILGLPLALQLDVAWFRPIVLLFLAVFIGKLYSGSLSNSRDIRLGLTPYELKRIRQVFIVGVIVLLNAWLLRDFNTLRWPFLWPRPLLFILLAALVAAVWYYQQVRTLWAFRAAGVLMVFIGQCYIWHSFQVMLNQPSLISVCHFLGAAGVSLVMFLNFINQVYPRYHKKAPLPPPALPVVAAVVPTYNEPLDVLAKTVISLTELDYPADRLHIVISDDGHRPEVRQLAQTHGVYYNSGARQDAKAGNLNSALQYLERERPEATLILTQDADEVLDPAFLKKVVGYFNDPKMAFVQTPKEVLAPYSDPFGTRDRLFYDRIQPGRNAWDAAFSCGSGVIWRISAVKAVGGFSTWNLVEDLTTSYLLHSAGYRSYYHSEILSIGLAPDDIPNLLKQRGTWAADTWRLFLFKNPFRQPGLSLRQRLQYLELCLFYATSVFFMPLLMAVPLLSLATGQYLPIEGAALFPWMAVNFIYYATLSRSRAYYLLRMWQYWLGHGPTYARALWIALRSRHKKPQYIVTRKTRQNGFYGYLLWPQFLYIVAGTVISIRAQFWMPDVNEVERLTNIAIFMFFAVMLWGICRASFYGVTPPGLLPSLRNPFRHPVAN